MFASRHIWLRRWKRGIKFLDEGVPKIPVWVQLRKIPIELWTAEGLSYLASVVGEPLYADSSTEQKRRLDYARICVMLDASKPLVKEFGVNTSSMGKDDPQGVTLLKVSYQWVPPECAFCKVFGHNTEGCSKSQNLTTQMEVRPIQAVVRRDEGKIWRQVSRKGKSVAFDLELQKEGVEVVPEVTVPSSSNVDREYPEAVTQGLEPKMVD